MEGILAYIGIGANVGNPLRQCEESIRALAGSPGLALERVSSFYNTEPVVDSEEHRAELEHQAWFVNAVAEIRTMISPRALLETLRNLEQQMGRTREFKGAPRIIDLDLLLYGQEVIAQRDLIVPHPEMHKRRFVLEPLCEMASYVVHPVFGISMRGLKERLDDRKAVLISR